METPVGLFAIGGGSLTQTTQHMFLDPGYNEASGMLRSIERFDGTSWATVSEVALEEPKVFHILLIHHIISM